ncbi:hypothetical protein AAD017_14105 [Proteus terrae]|uniref:hypothetical protein n=1 Tax=Proteus terrae TaxID=1574161 RepID=UPI0038AF1BBE
MTTDILISSDVETHNDICDQVNLIIQSVDGNLTKNKSQRRLLEHDALLLHLRDNIIPNLIKDNKVLFIIQTWLYHLHKPSLLERSDFKSEKNDNGNLLLNTEADDKYSNLLRVASNSQRYTRELREEIKPLLSRLFLHYPKQAGSLKGYIDEIDLMTSVTLAEVQGLIKSIRENKNESPDIQCKENK